MKLMQFRGAIYFINTVDNFSGAVEIGRYNHQAWKEGRNWPRKRKRREEKRREEKRREEKSLFLQPINNICLNTLILIFSQRGRHFDEMRAAEC